MQAPCIIVDDISTPGVAPDAPDFIGFFRGTLDPPLYSMPSDDWEADQARVCAYGDGAYADWYCNPEWLPASHTGWMSTKVWEHTAQNFVAQRLQAYIDDWSDTN